jgi:hypothetical protein
MRSVCGFAGRMGARPISSYISAMSEPPSAPRPRPQRLKPLTLGDLARGGVERIECECEWCRHEGTIALAPLLAKAGAGAAYRDVARQFRCSVCGWRGVDAWPVWPGRRNPRRAAKKGPPLPSLDECRALLAATPAPPDTTLAERRRSQIRALRERWPTLTASAAQFVVQTLGQER